MNGGQDVYFLLMLPVMWIRLFHTLGQTLVDKGAVELINVVC